MYAKSIHIYKFKCFDKARLDLQYPGRTGNSTSKLANVNLVIGNNGGGKSSVLRAIAIAALAPALLESGFVPYRLVRRPVRGNCLLKLVCAISDKEFIKANKKQPNDKDYTSNEIALLARIDDRKHQGYRDRLHLEHTPKSPLENLIYDDHSHAFFVVGYGALRRMETGDFSPSSARKTRGERYQRVASLFEDHVALNPFSAIFQNLSKPHKREAKRLLKMLLPSEIKFNGRVDEEGELLFLFHGKQTPYGSLSDGYKVFIAWVGDLIGRLSEVSDSKMKLRDIPGIVMIDEVDVHLHPRWQQSVVNDIATTFPNLQFIFTTHSPLVVNSLERENIFIADLAEDKSSRIRQSTDLSFGRTSDQILLSAYFGMESTRPQSDNQKTEKIAQKAIKGDTDAALEMLKHLQYSDAANSQQ